MGKIKSAVCLVLYTLLIAVLCFLCTVSFSYGPDGMYEFTSIIRMTAKDADLGNVYGANDTPIGGGYSVVYYPEGVISAEEYETDLDGFADEADREEYEARYMRYPDEDGALYLEIGEACGDDGAVIESFRTEFSSAVQTLCERVERLQVDGARVEVRDEFTVQVFLPEMMDGEYTAINHFAYTGELSIRYAAGTDEAAAEDIFSMRTNETVADYIQSVSSRAVGESAYVMVRLTDKGRAALAKATAGAAEESGTVYFYVGDTRLVAMSVSETFDQNEIYITSANYTPGIAKATAILFDTAIRGTQNDLSFTVGSAYMHPAQYGGNALTLMYVAFGVCFVGMMVFFFVRYKRLAFAHLYTYLLFLFGMVLCVWAIPFLYLSVETFLAFMLASVLLSFSNAMTFEAARKEYALGKTIVSSVKTGYKKSFWKLFDLHIVVAAIAFLTYAVALTGVQAFAFVLGLAAVFSGLGSLLVNRFTWAIMMAFTKRPGAFCNFKREEYEDE